MNQLSILLISSCGKAKLGANPNMPTWDALYNLEKRMEQLMANTLYAADTLYIGRQTSALKTSVELLEQHHHVDYYLISAGFGLLKSSDMIPPYESSFSGLSKAEIEERSKELDIQADLKQVLGDFSYDMIYLALGRNYMIAIDNLTLFKDYSGDLYHFNRNFSNKFNYIDSSEFVKLGSKSKKLGVPIGPTIAAKGTILLNYAIALQNHTIHDLTLSNWMKSLFDVN